MKKIIAFGFSSLFFAIVALFFQPATIHAQLVANDCRCDTANVAQPQQNGFNCNVDGEQRHSWCRNGTSACITTSPFSQMTSVYSATEFGITGEHSLNTVNVFGVTCEEQQTVKDCHCKAPGSNGNGNGIACNLSNGQPDPKNYFCPDSSLACFDDSDSSMHLDGLDNAIAKGIRCDRPRAVDCHCDGGGYSRGGTSVGNGFKCNFSGGTDNMHGFCSDTKEACIPGDANTTYSQANWDGSGRNEVAQGITCGKPRAIGCTCEHAGEVRSGRNGFWCNYNGGTHNVHAYCAHSDQACNAGGAGDFIENVNWNVGSNDRQSAQGVRCSKPEKIIFPVAEPPCIAGAYDDKGRCLAVLTAFGRFSTDPAGFILRVFGILISLAGAIALLLIMRAGYRIMTSRGNPEGIKEGREQIVAAVVGLIFLIFSFVFLQVIGSDLLGIPGFTGS